MPAVLARTVALLLLLLVPAAPAAASPDVDGPGRYYVFGTLDSGATPTTQQEERCAAHFGPRTATVITRLNARLFSFDADPASGPLWRTAVRATARTRRTVRLGTRPRTRVRVRARLDGRMGAWRAVTVRRLRP